MLTIDDLKKKIADVPLIFPPSFKRSLIVPKEIVCSEGCFAAFTIEGGGFGGIWDNHVDVVETEEQLPHILNQHEMTLYAYKVLR